MGTVFRDVELSNLCYSTMQGKTRNSYENDMQKHYSFSTEEGTPELLKTFSVFLFLLASGALLFSLV